MGVVRRRCCCGRRAVRFCKVVSFTWGSYTAPPILVNSALPRGGARSHSTQEAGERERGDQESCGPFLACGRACNVFAPVNVHSVVVVSFASTQSPPAAFPGGGAGVGRHA